MNRLQIGVIGSAGPEEYFGRKPNSKAYAIAEKVGALIAKNKAILICGGKGGIMESACNGARKYGGITVGVVSGNSRNTCNKYVDVEVVSGMINCSEESLIVSMSDALIILGGGSGTLQEIALAYRNEKPMVTITGIGGWGSKLANTYLDYRKKVKILSANDAEEAIGIVFNKLISSKGKK